MHYRAVGNRCAVCFADLEIPIPEEQCLSILKEKGFSRVDIDIVSLARSRVGVSRYRRSAQLNEAPETFDCSSFIKWLYGQKGIWLPRRSIQQREFGVAVQKENLRAGDIVFVSGRIDYYIDNPADGVGHVGIATENYTVIHAANTKSGLIESSFEEFTDEDSLRGIRRLVPNGRDVYTFITPLEREIEWSDDIRWIILQNL